MIIRSFAASKPQVGLSVPVLPSASARTGDQERLTNSFDPMTADWQSVMPQQAMLQDTLFGYIQMPPWDDLGGQFSF
jgi:hypothetical protein